MTQAQKFSVIQAARQFVADRMARELADTAVTFQPLPLPTAEQCDAMDDMGGLS